MLFEYIYNNIQVFANAYSKQEKKKYCKLIKRYIKSLSRCNRAEYFRKELIQLQSNNF